jgi:cadmium resistance protein CadD (predicted permease)
MFSLAFLAAAAFIATNIDNLFVLLAFLAEARERRWPVIAGQYAGSLALVAMSMLLAVWLTHLPDGYTGLLGVLPIGVGLSKVWTWFRTARQRPVSPAPPRAVDTAGTAAHCVGSIGNVACAPRTSSWWMVACVAVANGGDNVAVYVPLYAGHSNADCAWITGVFFVMTGAWCAGAAWLIRHPLLGAPIRRYGTALLPLILIAIGVSVIAQNNTLHVVLGF